MINVIVTDELVEISGHAGMGAPGQDIVCAAVSALGNTAASLMWEDPDERDGYLLIHYRSSDRDEVGYIRFLVAGLLMISEQYPDALEVQDFRSN